MSTIKNGESSSTQEHLINKNILISNIITSRLSAGKVISTKIRHSKLPYNYTYSL